MALAGLVADYSDSSGEETEESFVSGNREQPSTDYFGAAQTDSDDSDTEVPPTTSSGALPSPHFVSALPNPLAASTHVTEQSAGTVFGNRFAVQERAESAILEKHVKMTEDPTSSRMPCFKFKRGACRKGKNCRFSHDLGFQAPAKASEQTEEVASSDVHIISSGMPNKKRAGVTNTLLPAKRAKQSLESQRAKERPWTMHNQR